MVPVHIPTESHWLLVLISVLNVCLYIYDSARCTAATYRTIFDTIKEGFIRNELQWLSDEDKTLFQENNWDESTPQCPKQKNDTDCGVFTCLFAKHLLLSRGNHSGLTLNGEPRNEMASDLLNLASALRTENDLPEVFQWMADCQQASDNTMQRIPKNLQDKEVENAGLAYRQPATPKDGNCLIHVMHDQVVHLERVSQSATKLRSGLVNYLRNYPATPDDLISVNLLIQEHGTLTCEEWLWMVNGVTGLLYGA